jgi:hypothetical protein
MGEAGRYLTRFREDRQLSEISSAIQPPVGDQEEMSMKLSRRRLLAGATAGMAAPPILHWPANA